jgi:hypothetical protein
VRELRERGEGEGDKLDGVSRDRDAVLIVYALVPTAMMCSSGPLVDKS